ncbi:coiled-coil domain-containing protein 191 isoform X1 [Bufo bufo]|uniref:coiled-coil domain-containing protein 191 isoform X1 n=1 Tax=Bufo bufo TaxID=8384 RepID=UPI001ABDE681|nr:coiled-coil domain-containing protein 191 isoform X1 [Bufo bufo]
MLREAGEAVKAGSHKPELYRWRRQTSGAKAKSAFDYDNVEHWIKKVEQASEFAVSEVFSSKKPARRTRRPPALELQSVDQLHDHDEAYTEAQDLLSEWLGTKLKLEIGSEDENEPEVDPIEPAKPSPPEFVKYSRFDDLYDYLEKETETLNTQDFLQKLLQKEVMDSGILENLRSERSPKVHKQRDPRVTMEVRHQQVKENRLRRQREAERRRQELTLKRSALTEAQTLVQEENRQKALKAKKEEEAIQREMVKLRKEMSERKKVMEEARRAELRRQELEKKEETTQRTQRATEEPESRRLQKEAKIQELLQQIYAENHRCLQKHFSTWYKLALERRLRMGKARALADWKLQLKTFRAWRDHAWLEKMERESRQMENELRDQNRKQQAAADCYNRRLLRRFLVEWQLWCRGEKEKRVLEAQKEETKRKMVALLDAASSIGGHKQTNEDQRLAIVSSQETKESKVEESGSPKTEAPVTPHKKKAEGPMYAWQVTPQHATLTREELERHRLQTPSAPQGSSQHKKIPPYGENFENRQVFQQKLIEEQKRQLQEQKEMILGLMENQRLMIAKQEAKNASAVTAELSRRVIHRTGNDPSTQASPTHETPHRLPPSSAQSELPSTSPAHSAVSVSRRTTPHPAVTAMEERAAQRAERRRLLEETRRRREEEKLAQLQAAEEQRLQMEMAEKEAQLERKREEKRLQRQKEEEQQRRLQRERELLEKARLHNDRRLLSSCGLEPWKKLLEQCRSNVERAESHCGHVLLRRGLLCWSQTAREIVAEKIQRADQLCTTLLLRRTFQHWLKYKDYLSIQEERAVRRHRANLQRKTFIAWLDVAQEEKIAMWEKQRMAAEHNQRRILLSALRTWRRFPEVMKELRLQEERRAALRKRVAELLPDFKISSDNREL